MHIQRIKMMLESPDEGLDPHDILKAVLLYVLRYSSVFGVRSLVRSPPSVPSLCRYENTSGNKVDEFIEKLFKLGFDQEHVGVCSSARVEGDGDCNMNPLLPADLVHSDVCRCVRASG